jgi:phosphate transport system permease protein
MSTSTLTRPTPGLSLNTRRLPAWAPYGTAVAAAVVSFLLFRLGGLLGGGWVLTLVGTVLLYLLFTAAWAGTVEGRRAATNRVATALIYSAFALALLPLLSVAATLVGKGSARLDADFFTHSMNNITAFDIGGGAYHAIVGTLEQVGIAVLITVPLGVLGAVYIVEYGRGKLATLIRFFVDVMTGIPSIIAGLFILAFWVAIVSPALFGQARYSGFAASLALSVLMLPTITRSCEEMLRLVPAALREGAYALGIAKWKTVMRIVIPTALPGIVTGVMLAVARACGETAPVLLVAGGNDRIITDPFSGNQSSLSIYIYQQATSAAKGDYGLNRAWTAALTLVALVLALTVAAKLLSTRTKLNTRPGKKSKG